MSPLNVLRLLLAVWLASVSLAPLASTETGIAWTRAASDAEVDAAFAQARAAKKPLFLYWGAKWCPPCNQLDATLFNRQDFIERSRAFVPVYVDGDRPGAQKLGTRFKVRGYPTMLLFDAQGTELTRLPGEVDAAQYTQVLTLGMSAQRPVKAVLADARAGGDAARRLGANDWKLLAFYSWETDEQQLVSKAQLATTLRQLADACPADQADSSARLLLKSLAAAPAAAPGPAPAASPVDTAARARLLQVLADPPQARTQMDVLTNNAAELARAVSADGTPERAQLLASFSTALKRLAADTSLSRADRMTAVIAQVNLAKAGAAKDAKVALPATLLADVREHSARADREVSNGYERQAVIPTAAYLLAQAGLGEESDTLLKANLAKSHSPYYLMSGLADNAKKRGDKAGALRWYEQAFDTSEGPATRLQWGASYVAALVELAPDDAARIEKAASKLLAEAAAQPNAFHERSARSLQRAGSRLLAWNERGTRTAVLNRLQARLDDVCRRLDSADPQRATCESLLRPAPKKDAAA
jgi:thioredoxin-related protein